MTVKLGTPDRPLRAAIVGAGPSGFYAAAALLKEGHHTVTVDMFDHLVAPHGLVRYGVAPDHQNIKAVSKVFDRTAAEPGFRYFGNVEFGQDLTHEDLKRHYDVIIFAVGAQSDRKLNIPGEDLPNSMSATEFVAWYNGHPDYKDLEVDLSGEAAVVVGVGNVAMDVARILAKSVDELQDTDIADHALDALAHSNIKDIYIVARRGPAQVKFTNAEVREMGHLEVADALVLDEELRLDRASSAAVQDDVAMQKNLDYLRAYAEIGATGKPRRVHFRFLLSPVEIIAEERQDRRREDGEERAPHLGRRRHHGQRHGQVRDHPRQPGAALGGLQGHGAARRSLRRPQGRHPQRNGARRRSSHREGRARRVRGGLGQARADGRHRHQQAGRHRIDQQHVRGPAEAQDYAGAGAGPGVRRGAAAGAGRALCDDARTGARSMPPKSPPAKRAASPA